MTHCHRKAALAAPLALALALPFAAAQAQDFGEDARFELRLSGFQSDSSIRFAGTGVATNGEETESAEGAGTIDIGQRWRPRGELTFSGRRCA